MKNGEEYSGGFINKKADGISGTFKDVEKIYKAKEKLRKYCEYCGHSNTFDYYCKSKPCTYCRQMTFLNEQEKFKYEISKRLKRRIK